ncbi:hypothetical protein GDO86_018423, partial [Hymenochirus boettgeri]
MSSMETKIGQSQENHKPAHNGVEETKGSPCISGFIVEKTKEKISIYQALQQKLVSQEVAVLLLEAQAATGNISDSMNKHKYSVQDAVHQGIVGQGFQERLLIASKSVNGFKHKDESLSLFQAFKKGLVNRRDTERFLEAQLATGGVILNGQQILLEDALNQNHIDEDMFRILSTGSIKHYLDPNTQEATTYKQLLTKCIRDADTGLLLLPLQETLQGLRKPVTAEQLLQANIITQALYDNIRQGLGPISGIYIESTKEKISIYQAMKKNFLTSDVALALLEAQAASGAIIDPMSNKMFSVMEAIKEELVGLEFKEKLLTAEKSVTGFNDPYTSEKISLFQAIKKELIDKIQGIKLIEVQVATGGIIDPVNSFHVPLETAYQRGLSDKEMTCLLSEKDSPKGFLDPSTNDPVTYSELRKKCIVDSELNLHLLPLKFSFSGIRGRVTVDELLGSKIIDKKVYEGLQNGSMTVTEVADQKMVKKYLEGTGCIAGIFVASTNETKSIYQAMKEHFLPHGASVALLEAQAATGYLLDPRKNQTFSVDEAVKNGLVGPELYEKLLAAEKAAIGYNDPYTGEKISLFQAMGKNIVLREHGLHLLEAQVATGGIIDSLQKHRVPMEVAYERGFLNDETNKELLDLTDEAKGYFDPNSEENLTYGQILQRCRVDPSTDLFLFPVFDKTLQTQNLPGWLIDYETKMTLTNIEIPVISGKYKGESVSIWKLLLSDYFPTEERNSMLNQYKSGNLSVEELTSKLNATITEIVSNTKVTFEGLRERVTPGQLLNADIIDKNLYEKLEQGEASVKDVVNMDMVRNYLQGTGCIAGLIITETQEKMSIYEAKKKALLRPGTSLILLEAQAATGFIIDPVRNKKYLVDEALKANVIGPEFYEKLLSAEKSVTGYKDPYTEGKISLFQAMNKGLIVKDHGIRLLEAQIASGGIIDPINSHRIPVEVAYKRGYFDKRMNLILSDPSDDTKGFFDPNTNENLTYLQLKDKCITDSATNLCLLPLHSTKSLLSINDHVKESFRSLEISVKYGRFRGQTVSAWVLINSEYFSEWKRRFLIEQFRLRKKNIQEIVILIEEELNKWTDICFPTIRGQVNIYLLLEYEIIHKDLFQQVLDGKMTTEDVMKIETVRKHLQGFGIIGGILLQPSNQRISFYEATKRRILLPSTILPILEAQAATGHIIDPVNNKKLSVDEALKAGIIDPEFYDKLLAAEEAVIGYKDPYTGKKTSLYQAMRKGLVDEKHAMRLLDAQLATGGIIDPDHAIHLPVPVASKHGYFNEELYKTLSESKDATKSYYDPTTKQMVTYSELVSRSKEDSESGTCFYPLPEDFIEVPIDSIYSDEEVKQTFKNKKIIERKATLWELIHYGYFTEEQRSDIVERYKLKKATLQEVTTEILQVVKDNELKMTTHINFQGLRGKVPAIQLLNLGILNQATFDKLLQGSKSIDEVSQIDSVKKYLKGTGCISGVFLKSTKQKMSINQAMKKHLIMPANGLLLLEAQAATGFLIDPSTNQEYSVDRAVKDGVVGPEFHEKLSVAESAVTGYMDPYTGNKISLLQAMVKNLVPQNEAIPLLQAQLAAGGIIDPANCHYVPLQMSYKLGFLDEEINLAKSAIHEKPYFDPNTKENISYQDLKEKCSRDPDTDLLLLPLSDCPALYADEHIITVFKAVTVNVKGGRLKGQTVSLWDLLNSEYVDLIKVKEFLTLYKSSSDEGLKAIVKTITDIVQETENQSKKIQFKGLRRQVSASDLFLSEVIDKKTLDDLNLGKKTIMEVTEMDNVKRYLEGTNCIAGVLIQATNKKMSIYDAMLKGILRPGTALVLLEAQAATGFIVEPVNNKKLSVDEAFASGIIGHQVYKKLLSAEQAVTGYTDPHTGQKNSLFQAMSKHLIVECHGIRLLEAQIATGGIIDPLHSHRVPVDVAYKRGYFNEDMNKILSDPTDDTKGFFDPNTHENLTYLQLVERCIQDPETGLYLLQVVMKGDNYFYITDSMKDDLRSKTIQMYHGKFANQTVSIWEILSSHYITELKRRELVRLYTMGVLTVEQLVSSLTTIIMDYESKSNTLMFKAMRGEVSATELFNADIIDLKTLEDLRSDKKTVEDVAQMDSVRKYLKETRCIAGVSVLPQNEILSIYEAIKTEILPQNIGLQLLEAQAATGFLVDPVKNVKCSVSEALAAGLIKADVQKVLELAEQAVTGFGDPNTGNKLSLLQAMKKGLVDKEHGLYLLEAQISTGGVIDPLHGFRVPQKVAYKKGYLDEDSYILVSDTDNGKKGFTDPNTHERITYKSLMDRATKDPATGLYLLQVTKKLDDYFYVDEPTKNLLLSTNVTMKIGKFEGQQVSLWDILCSAYVSEDKRKELIKKYKTETAKTIKSIIDSITLLVEETDQREDEIWFQGLRKQVTASELYNAGIIDKETLDKLKQKSQTVAHVANNDLVKRYLEGTSCIAGVLVPSVNISGQKEKMNLYTAMLKQILRPGTALVLLEAQAATGFMIDCIHNKKLSVDNAVASGLIGHEIYEKLLCAERGVTGYTDPYSGGKISLFQAMKKDLLVKDHGIRLLEAQIATGGIIDPVQSHRIPVEVAYKRGYFDEEMNEILADPMDDTKGFFDPNTHENLTYMQLIKRCVQDPSTGLYMLEIQDSQLSPVQTQYNLQHKTVQLKTGLFQGKEVSLWDLIHSKYISTEKRDELLKKYYLGTMSTEQLTETISTIIYETEKKMPQVDSSDSANQDEWIKSILQSEKVNVTMGDFKGNTVSLWDILNSHYFSEDERKKLLERMKSGSFTTVQMTAAVIKMITKIEMKKNVRCDYVVPEDQIQKALQNVTIHVTKGQYKDSDVSVWNLLNSQYVTVTKRQELLMDYRLTIEDIVGLVKDIKSNQYDLDNDALTTLQTVKAEVSVGELKGQKQTVWELVNSKYFSEDKRKELLDLFNRETLNVHELTQRIITIIEETEEKANKLKFKGLRRQVTATELLTSEIIDQDTLRELAQGRKTLKEVTEMGTVKRYLEGESCIAGILVPSVHDPTKKEKMSIYNAMLRNILRPGTALVLLEAQAATGFIIDPIRNTKHSVEEAVAAGIIGQELQTKLLSAERAVTGYKDPYTGDKISLFQAMQKELIVKDHGIRLLEAQIATGGIIDPVHSHRVPVEVAYKRGYFDKEMNQILADDSDDTKGFFDPNTHENLTYLQLLQRCIKDPDSELCLLEVIKGKLSHSKSETSTEGKLKTHMVLIKVGQYKGQNISLWELLHSQYFTEDKRLEFLKKYKSGTMSITELMATVQVISKLIEDKDEKTDEELQQALEREITEVHVGEFKGQKVSLWVLINSKYITEQKRKELLEKYKSGQLSEEEMLKIIITIIEEIEKKSHNIKFKGLRKQVSATELLQSKIIDATTMNELTQGSRTVEQVTQMDSVKRYLEGTSPIAGVFITSTIGEPQREKMTIYGAMHKRILRPGTALVLLEAQAATGFVIDPIQNKKLSVEEALAAGLIGSEIYNKLLSAERGVTGYTEPYTGEKISLFQAMKKDLIVKDHGIRLLEAQIATGGIIDPVHSHRVPVDVAYKRGYFDEEMNTILSDPSDDTKGFFDPNNHENLTYMQLLERCVKDPDTGLFMLDVKGTKPAAIHTDYKRTLQSTSIQFHGRNVSLWEFLHSQYIDKENQEKLLKNYKSGTLTLEELIKMIEKIISEKETQNLKDTNEQLKVLLQNSMTRITLGQFKGQTISLWDLLHSKYISAEKRNEILKSHLKGSLTIEGIIDIITSVIEEAEERSSKLKFKGLRRQVTATELLDSNIIDLKTLDDLCLGNKTLEEVTQMDSVKRYLEGTNSIAGVFVPSKKDPSKMDKMSIYQAMWKHILRPGTALVLLEAQAATGFIIDPLKNRKLSVDEAVSAGVVGKDLQAKLLSAERAVTGYKDPYTGEKISLFQAMKKQLIVKDHGIRLLEAQIATGGIIDPVHSHRVPVEVAYKRGYFDEEMNQILSDPTDDTKGFFDPNTHENLTYLKLLERCIKDPDTGLSMLEVKDVKSTLFHLDRNMQSLLQSKSIQINVGLYKGQNLSLWELLTSHYLSRVEMERQDLLKKYKSGTITVQKLTEDLEILIAKSEKMTSSHHLESSASSKMENEGIQNENFLKSVEIQVNSGYLKGQNVSVWHLLNSSYTSPEQKNELLQKYKSGALSLEGLVKATKTIIEQAENTIIKAFLKSVTVEVPAGELTIQGKTLSMWELLHSEYITEEKRKELFEKYQSKVFTWEEIFSVIISIIKETEKRSKEMKFKGLRKQVSASELLESKIIDQNTLIDLTQGTKTLDEVTEMDSVKRYLEGTSCIAGILVPSKNDPSKKEKMSIYEAKVKGILRPGTALVLLEAQAATGFVIDPIKNKKLSVDEAAATRLIGQELHLKLLSAEKAVTGYQDPRTGQKISLFQAMQKGFIVKDHGVRLLEAQIATGGIIDPVHSHRVPVEVAYKRGYFDEEMNQILLDPTDDTKGFFDPNTHENLTYMQLLQKCVRDPDTGLCVLEPVPQTGHQPVITPIIQFTSQSHRQDTSRSLHRSFSLPATIHTDYKRTLQSTSIRIPDLEFEGKNVYLWEILNSKYISTEKREELLKNYRSGTLSIEEMKSIIITIITKDVAKSPPREPIEGKNLLDEIQALAQAEMISVDVGEFNGKMLSLWEILHSRYISEETRKDFLEKIKLGSLTVQNVSTAVLNIIRKTEMEMSQKVQHRELLTVRAEEIQKALEKIFTYVKAVEFKGKEMSVWDLLHSKYVPETMRNKLLGDYKLTIRDMLMDVETDVLACSKLPSRSEFNLPKEMLHILETETIEVSFGEFKGQKQTVWDLLNSKYISEDTKKEMLEKFCLEKIN